MPMVDSALNPNPATRYDDIIAPVKISTRRGPFLRVTCTHATPRYEKHNGSFSARDVDVM